MSPHLHAPKSVENRDQRCLVMKGMFRSWHDEIFLQQLRHKESPPLYTLMPLKTKKEKTHCKAEHSITSHQAVETTQHVVDGMHKLTVAGCHSETPQLPGDFATSKLGNCSEDLLNQWRDGLS